MEEMDAYHIILIKGFEEDSQMEDVEVREVISLFKLISLVMIYHTLGERLSKVMMVGLEDLEGKMVRMVVKLY